ncbi:hypothetical protein [Nitrobacter sp.]|jgi:hypothetical protein|uniref:hypothetical protein n=1 Tax=Nitrobacter sp. TaxID=29420 RepID=UPI003F64F5AD
MERELAKSFMDELTSAGTHMNRLHELIHTHISGDELQKEFRRSLGEVMGAVAVLQLYIANIYPDLDPDKK